MTQDPKLQKFFKGDTVKLFSRVNAPDGKKLASTGEEVQIAQVQRSGKTYRYLIQTDSGQTAWVLESELREA